MSAEIVRRDLGKQITGPSALAGDPRRFFLLTRTLAVTEFKLRFFGSILGYFWQLMRPLMLFGVLYVVFTQFVKVSTQKYYPVSLLLGIVLYTFFAEATSGAVSCVVDRENLVRKIHFPRLAIPLSVVLTATFNLALNLVVVLIFGLVQGVGLHWTTLEVVPLLALVIVFAAGLATLLSALFVRYRDLRPIWEVVLQVMFYGSMIIVPFETVASRFPTAAKILLAANPLATVVQQARHGLVNSTVPGAGTAMGGNVFLVVPLFIAVGFLALGLWVFNREAPRVAEDL